MVGRFFLIIGLAALAACSSGGAKGVSGEPSYICHGCGGGR